MGSKPTLRGPKKPLATGVRGDKLERRASWVMLRWEVRPSLRYDEMRAEIMERYEISITTAERVITRAYELMRTEREAFNSTERLFAKYMSMVETCERRGDMAEARRIMKDCRDHLGIGAPTRVHVSGNVTMKVEDLRDLTDEELALLAKLDEPRTQAEQAVIAAAQDTTIDVDGDDADSTLDAETFAGDSPGE